MMVRGTIDLWFEENGEIYVVDYKTDDIATKDLTTRADNYAPQLALYSLAIEQAFERRPLAPGFTSCAPIASSKFR